jgi:glycosyltransferase involved in cell wall biosynthesis
LKNSKTRLSLSGPSGEKRLTVLLIDNDGFSDYTCCLARGLSRYLNVILYGFSKESFNVTGANTVIGLKFHDIKKRLPKGQSPISGIIRIFFLFFILLTLLVRTKYDIVHVQDYLPAFFLFIPFLKLRRKQICWTLHDLEIFNFAVGINGKLQKLFLRLVSQPALMTKYVDKIFVHAFSLREQLIAKKVDYNKVLVMPIFDYRYLLELKDNNREAKPYDSMLKDSYVLFFGNIAPWKGINILLDAARMVRNKLGQKFNLVIAGEPYRGFRSIQFFKDLNNEDIQFIKIIDKFITSSEIPYLVSKSSFLVLPYNNLFQHSASGVIPLAYTFARPVVVSNLPSLVEYVDHGKTGLIFEVNDSKQVANCIIELVKNNSKCLEMGRTAYQKVVSEMSLDVCCKKINDYYNNLNV